MAQIQPSSVGNMQIQTNFAMQNQTNIQLNQQQPVSQILSVSPTAQISPYPQAQSLMQQPQFVQQNQGFLSQQNQQNQFLSEKDTLKLGYQNILKQHMMINESPQTNKPLKTLLFNMMNSYNKLSKEGSPYEEEFLELYCGKCYQFVKAMKDFPCCVCCHCRINDFYCMTCRKRIPWDLLYSGWDTFDPLSDES